MNVAGDVGLWCEISRHGPGQAALFLDRDGVVIEEVGYLGGPENVRMISGAAEAIARCNRRDIPVVLVTNQSGVGRGYYGWESFCEVQAVIAKMLAAADAQIDAVLACAYHAEAREGFRIADHPWRKPNPGMVLEAIARMGIDPHSSWIVGDRASDIQAGREASLAGGVILGSGYGQDDSAKALELARGNFSVKSSWTLADAVSELIASGRLRA